MFAFPRSEDVENFDLENNEIYFHLIGLPMSIKSFKKDINTYLMPEAIRKASFEIYSTIFGEIWKAYIVDHGDLNFESLPIEVLNEKIKEINENFNKKNIFVFLGGNHLITYYTIKALNPDLVIHFDAHPDVDVGELKNSSFFRYLLREKNFELVQIGICNGSKEEFDFLKIKKIPYFTSLDFYKNKEQILNLLKEKIKNSKRIYITIDVDFLKNNIASYQPEALGIELMDFLIFIDNLMNKELVSKLVGFDLVELDPTKDINNCSTLMTTRLLLELIAIINKNF